jgi:hypothetical protein
MSTRTWVRNSSLRFHHPDRTRSRSRSRSHSRQSLTQPSTDKEDEALNKWKASLGLGQGKDISDPSDPRKCIIYSLGLEVEGRPDIIIDLKSPGALEALEKKPFVIKEGATFRMKAQFKVQHEILAGLKYLQKVTRMGVSNKMQEMMVRTISTRRANNTDCIVRVPTVLAQKRSRFTRRSVSSASMLHLPLLTNALHSRARDGSLWHARPWSLHRRVQVR